MYYGIITPVPERGDPYEFYRLLRRLEFLYDTSVDEKRRLIELILTSKDILRGVYPTRMEELMAYDEQYFLQCFGSKGYEIYVKDPILYKYKKFLYYKDIKTFYSLICEIFYAH